MRIALRAGAMVAVGVLGVGLAGGVGATTPGTAPDTTPDTTPGTTPDTMPARPVLPGGPARPSSGCSADPRPGQRQVTIEGAEPGFYYVYTPGWQQPGEALPMVVDLHGFGEPAATQVKFSQLSPFGAFAGFVTITPQIPRTVPRWDVRPGSVDLSFVLMAIEQAESRGCVDTSRVYVTGLSNGAMMTSRIACDLADRVAAVAMVAGVQDPADCSPSRPVPMIAFHGTADTFLSYDGGLGTSVADLPNPSGVGTLGTTEMSVPGTRTASVPEVMAAWAQRDGCQPTPAESTVAADVTLFDYDCPADTDVRLYRIDGGGHTWPGSSFSAELAGVVGATAMDISANQVMWEFFRQYSLTPPANG